MEKGAAAIAAPTWKTAERRPAGTQSGEIASVGPRGIARPGLSCGPMIRVKFGVWAGSQSKRSGRHRRCLENGHPSRAGALPLSRALLGTDGVRTLVEQRRRWGRPQAQVQQGRLEVAPQLACVTRQNSLVRAVARSKEKAASDACRVALVMVGRLTPRGLPPSRWPAANVPGGRGGDWGRRV